MMLCPHVTGRTLFLSKHSRAKNGEVFIWNAWESILMGPTVSIAIPTFVLWLSKVKQILDSISLKIERWKYWPLQEKTHGPFLVCSIFLALPAWVDQLNYHLNTLEKEGRRLTNNCMIKVTQTQIFRTKHHLYPIWTHQIIEFVPRFKIYIIYFLLS